MTDDGSAKLGGGTLSQRVQRGERLRAPERDAAEHATRLASGEAWRDFCRALVEREHRWRMVPAAVRGG